MSAGIYCAVTDSAGRKWTKIFVMNQKLRPFPRVSKKRGAELKAEVVKEGNWGKERRNVLQTVSTTLYSGTSQMMRDTVQVGNSLIKQSS